MILRRGARISLAVAIGMVSVLGVAATFLAARYKPLARQYAISSLKQRYQSDVTLGSFDISFFPMVRITGENLVMRLNGRQDVPPMVLIRRFSVRAHFFGLIRSPRHIQSLRVEGLELHLPPRAQRGTETRAEKNPSEPFIFDDVVADGAILQTLPADAAKQPLTFEIQRLHLGSAGIGSRMNFHAELMNPKPRGPIESDGQFGPWEASDPGATPIEGRYIFRNASLAVFKGISGTLASQGDYKGKLAQIEVRGSADVPDFALSYAGNPMHLQTAFTATVDGTNGNATLRPASAVLGNSKFEVSGAIERDAGMTRKEIDLNARSSAVQLGDVLRLTVKSVQPPMTGGLVFTTGIKILPRDGSMLDRLRLRGNFSMAGVKFTSPDVQQKIAGLSHRAEGEPKDQNPDVAASLSGQFQLVNGTMTVPRLEVAVPGAKLGLDGKYALETGDIDFKGTAKLDATVSQMTTGIKRVMLKPVDPLFEHGGVGAQVPVVIGGTRGKPSFRLDIGRVMRAK